jgi:hypothetical protein
MGALAVVLFTPGRECTPHIVQSAEPVSVEAFIAKSPVEALDMTRRLKLLVAELSLHGEAANLSGMAVDYFV